MSWLLHLLHVPLLLACGVCEYGKELTSLAEAEFTVIREMHPEDLTESRQKLFEFLCGWLGGPQLYMERRGHPKLRMRHAPFSIGASERDQWLACMAHAMDQLEIDGDLRAFLDARFAHVADFMRNRPE